tara:strand:- start:221 stop:1756 length:1536 start_codon:yes stop_codon:yes gene_type:complete
MADSEAQKIGRHGEDLFRTLLPNGWLKHKRDPDPYTDFFVEPVENGDQLSVQAYFQVKSKKLVIGKPKCLIEVKTLKFALNSKVPVFAALIDTENKCGWHTDLSSIAQSLKTSPAIWDQNETTIHFKRKNTLNDREVLLESINSAWQTQSSLRPGSVADAAKKLKTELEEADPRFGYKITHDGIDTKVICVARESDSKIAIKVISKTESGNKHVQKAIDEGGTIASSDDVTVQITNPPGSLGKVLEGDVEIKNTADGTIKWEFYDAAGERISSHIFEAKWKGGTRVRKTELLLPGADIFSGQYKLSFFPDEKRVQNDFQMSIKYSQWDGSNVNNLDGFHQIQSVFGNVHKSKSFAMGPIIEADWIKSINNINEFEPLPHIGGFVQFLEKLQRVSDEFGLEIIFDHSKIDDELELIEDLYDGISPDGFLVGSGTMNFVLESNNSQNVASALQRGVGLKHAVPKKIVIMGRDCGFVIEETFGDISNVNCSVLQNGDVQVSAEISDIRKRYVQI